jgi:hypothetical protein
MITQHAQRRFCRWTAAVLCAVAILLACEASAARAQSTIVAFSFQGNNGATTPWSASTVDPSLVPGVQISNSADLTMQGKANSFNATGWPTASSVTTTLGFYTFSITPKSGDETSLNNISINLQKSNGGPTQFTLRTSLDSFGKDVTTPLALTANNTNTAYTTSFAPYLSSIGQTGPFTQSIEFRMYGYAAVNGNLWLTDNGATPGIVLTGGVTPIPEPASVLCIVAAAFGLLRLLQRWKRQPVVQSPESVPA